MHFLHFECTQHDECEINDDFNDEVSVMTWQRCEDVSENTTQHLVCDLSMVTPFDTLHMKKRMKSTVTWKLSPLPRLPTWASKIRNNKILNRISSAVQALSLNKFLTKKQVINMQELMSQKVARLGLEKEQVLNKIKPVSEASDKQSCSQRPRSFLVVDFWLLASLLFDLYH